MPTVFEASLDGSQSVRYFHVPLIGFYLESARDHAQASLVAKDANARLRNVISAIAFSAMALEAFINEISEDVIPKSDRTDFDKGRKQYKKPSGKSSVSFRFSRLVSIKHGVLLSPRIFESIENLATIRNTLVHYKLSDTAGKYIMPPPAETETPEGGVMISFSFSEQPFRVEPQFLQRVTAEAAVTAYNSALGAIRYWHQLCGDEQKLEKFSELSFAMSKNDVAEGMPDKSEK